MSDFFGTGIGKQKKPFLHCFITPSPLSYIPSPPSSLLEDKIEGLPWELKYRIFRSLHQLDVSTNDTINSCTALEKEILTCMDRNQSSFPYLNHRNRRTSINGAHFRMKTRYIRTHPQQILWIHLGGMCNIKRQLRHEGMKQRKVYKLLNDLTSNMYTLLKHNDSARELRRNRLHPQPSNDTTSNTYPIEENPNNLDVN